MKRQIALIAAAISLAAMPALAEDVSTSDVYACKDIVSDADRLTCYDAAVGRLKAAEETLRLPATACLSVKRQPGRRLYLVC